MSATSIGCQLKHDVSDWHSFIWHLFQSPVCTGERSQKKRQHTHTHTHTHLDKTDSTFCAKFMIMMHVPSSMSRHQQLETKTKERNPRDQCLNITFIMSM